MPQKVTRFLIHQNSCPIWIVHRRFIKQIIMHTDAIVWGMNWSSVPLTILPLLIFRFGCWRKEWSLKDNHGCCSMSCFVYSQVQMSERWIYLQCTRKRTCSWITNPSLHSTKRICTPVHCLPDHEPNPHFQLSEGWIYLQCFCQWWCSRGTNVIALLKWKMKSFVIHSL